MRRFWLMFCSAAAAVVAGRVTERPVLEDRLNPARHDATYRGSIR